MMRTVTRISIAVMVMLVFSTPGATVVLLPPPCMVNALLIPLMLVLVEIPTMLVSSLIPIILVEVLMPIMLLSLLMPTMLVDVLMPVIEVDSLMPTRLFWSVMPVMLVWLLMPVIDVLDRHFGVESGAVTTMHASMNDQSVIDAYHPDLRRAPQFAEHTDDVLLSLGYDMDKIIELKIEGAIT